MSQPLLAMLYEALSSDLGKVISASDVEHLRQQFYKARREANDPELDRLSFVPSPSNPDGELWIVKKS